MSDFPQKIRNKRRSSAKWFLLFCLSQFVVHLFTFLLVPHRRPVLRLVLRGRLLGAFQRCALLIFGFLHWLALACRCGSRLFGFRARDTISVNLRMLDSEVRFLGWDCNLLCDFYSIAVTRRSYQLPLLSPNLVWRLWKVRSHLFGRVYVRLAVQTAYPPPLHSLVVGWLQRGLSLEGGTVACL